MKLILENWRNYREDALLVEEIGNLFNQLEQQLLNEDLMDSLSDTWESIKTSTGKAKDKAIEIYNKIMEKINDWIQTIVDNNQTKEPSGTELSQAISDIKNKPQSYDARKGIKEASKNNNNFEIKLPGKKAKKRNTR